MPTQTYRRQCLGLQVQVPIFLRTCHLCNGQGDRIAYKCVVLVHSGQDNCLMRQLEKVLE